MNKKSLKFLSRLLCVVMLVALFLQAPLEASQSGTIAIKVGGQTFNVTPGQWVSVTNGDTVTHYNVRFINGRPVALDMSQHASLVLGQSGEFNLPGQSGEVVQIVDTSQPTTNADAAAPSAPVRYRDPDTGRFISKDDAIARGLAQPDATQPANPVEQVSQTTQTAQPETAPAETAPSAPVRYRDPDTGRFISKDDAIARGLAQPDTPTTTDTAQAPTTTEQSTWDPTSRPRDPQTGRFISREEAIARGLLEPSGEQVAQSSSDASQTGQAGDASQAGQAGDASQAGQAGDASQAGQAGDASQAGQAGDASQVGQAGDASQAGQAGDASQVGQAGDASQAGQAGDASQTGQAGDASQVGQAGDASQAVQAGQAAQAAQAANKKAGFGQTISDNFHSGYNVGKDLTNQGFQNVQDSLKSGFSAKNILVTAGITVGVDLASQIMSGQTPSARRALGLITSAEFVGGVVGSVSGAAAGSFFVPFLSAIPVVGGALSALAPAFGSIVGSSAGAYLAGDLKNGRFSIKEAFRRIDWVGVTGQAIGSTIGATLGSALGPIGTIAGGMIGGYVGNWAAQRISGLFDRNSQANLPTFNSVGASPAMAFGPTISIGDTPVSLSQNVDTSIQPATTQAVTVEASKQAPSIGTLESEVALASARYQELYQLYNELLRESRQEDALMIVDAMNEAKLHYETLLATSGK